MSSPPPPCRISDPASTCSGWPSSSRATTWTRSGPTGRGSRIAGMRGNADRLTTDPTRNVVGIAAAAALRLLDARAPGERPPGVRLWLDKRMPLASGLGSSAASSVAGALAVSELLGGALDRSQLIDCALEGERAVSGGVHADNVAPCVTGGFVLIRSYAPMELLSLPVPETLRVAVVHPHTAVSTAEARRLVAERRFEIADAVANLGQLGAMITALHRADLELLGRSISDALVEPVRAPLVPGFAEVKRAALDAGALGCSLSRVRPVGVRVRRVGRSGPDAGRPDVRTIPRGGRSRVRQPCRRREPARRASGGRRRVSAQRRTPAVGAVHASSIRERAGPPGRRAPFSGESAARLRGAESSAPPGMPWTTSRERGAARRGATFGLHRFSLRRLATRIAAPRLAGRRLAPPPSSEPRRSPPAPLSRKPGGVRSAISRRSPNCAASDGPWRRPWRTCASAVSQPRTCRPAARAGRPRRAVAAVRAAARSGPSRRHLGPVSDSRRRR